MRRAVSRLAPSSALRVKYPSRAGVQISRSLLFLVDMVDTEENVRALEDTRDVIDQSTLDPEPFGFSGVFVFTEQFLVIYDELIENFILALVAVAVLSLLILGNVGVVVLVCVSVVSERKCFPLSSSIDVRGKPS